MPLRWLRFIVFAPMVGCLGWGPPDLDLVDEVPVVSEGYQCERPRKDWVACVLDGDTFDLGACGDENGERIRMLGIDAPEIAHEENPADCYGNESGNELTRMIENATVYLTFDRDCAGVYGRTLAYVWLLEDAPVDDTDEEPEEFDVEKEDAAILLNEWMLSNGFARLYDEEWVGELRHQLRLETAYGVAQARGVGLWSACEGETR